MITARPSSCRAASSATWAWSIRSENRFDATVRSADAASQFTSPGAADSRAAGSVAADGRTGRSPGPPTR